MARFAAKHFKDDLVLDLMSHLVNTGLPGKENLLSLEELKSMTADEIRSTFADKLNDGSLVFSTYTMSHLNKRKGTT